MQSVLADIVVGGGATLTGVLWVVFLTLGSAAFGKYLFRR